MSVHKSSVKCKLSYILLSLILTAVFGIWIFFGQLSRHINEISEFEGKKAANDLISRTVDKVLKDNCSDNLAEIKTDENGRITSIGANSSAVNKILNDITTGVNDDLKNFESEQIKVPLGTLSGINYFTGRGFNVTLRLHQIGAVKTELKSEFVSAGINQTKYRLYGRVTVEMSAILPAHSTDITVSSDYLISETVIVGEIPKMYLSK